MKASIAVVVLFFLFGCVPTGLFSRYDSEMERVAKLYSRGKITDNQKRTVIKYGEAFWLSYNQSLDDLDTFLRYTRALPLGAK